MGEPLANLPGILPAVEALTDPMRLAPWHQKFRESVVVSQCVSHDVTCILLQRFMLDLCYTVTFTCAFNLENREAMSGKKVVVSTVGPSPAQVRALQRLSRALVQIVEFSWPNRCTLPESLRLSTGVVLALCG